MTPQFKLGISVGLIACLLAMAILPAETESTPAGWVGYGIIIGLLLSVAIRAFRIISYQTNYKRLSKHDQQRNRLINRKEYTNYSR